jgi:transposase
MFQRNMDLTDKQWEVLGPLLPPNRVRDDGKGRPWKDPRDILNAILWILRTGAPWADLPGRYPSYQTCHRRFQQWVQEGTLDRLLRALAQDLRGRGGLDLSETFIDGSFAGAKKGGLVSGKPRKERGPRSWQSQTALVFLSPFGSKALRPTK